MVRLGEFGVVPVPERDVKASWTLPAAVAGSEGERPSGESGLGEKQVAVGLEVDEEVVLIVEISSWEVELAQEVLESEPVAGFPPGISLPSDRHGERGLATFEMRTASQ